MNDLHEPAMKGVGSVKAGAMITAFRALARMAAESNAATADFKMEWLSDSEVVEAQYVPELILRVREVNAPAQTAQDIANESALRSGEE